jgi:hypothetical protein
MQTHNGDRITYSLSSTSTLRAITMLTAAVNRRLRRTLDSAGMP